MMVLYSSMLTFSYVKCDGEEVSSVLPPHHLSNERKRVREVEVVETALVVVTSRRGREKERAYI